MFGPNKKVARQSMVVVLKNDEHEALEIETEDSECKLILLAGKPIGEKIHKYGPFVTGSYKEMMDTFDDYQSGKNGFENSQLWSSEIRKLASWEL